MGLQDVSVSLYQHKILCTSPESQVMYCTMRLLVFSNANIGVETASHVKQCLINLVNIW